MKKTSKRQPQTPPLRAFNSLLQRSRVTVAAAIIAAWTRLPPALRSNLGASAQWVATRFDRIRKAQVWRRLPKSAWPGLIVALGVVLFAYFMLTKSAPQPLKRTARPPLVAVQPVVKQSVAPTLRLFGQVETPKLSVVTAAIEADVLRVLVLQGHRVEKGQLLLELDPSDSELARRQRQAEVAEIQAQLDSDSKRYAADQRALAGEQVLLSLSQKAVARARRLARSSAGSEATLDSAQQAEQRQLLSVIQRQLSIDDFSARQALWQARLRKAQAALERATRDRARSQLRAPFAGRVVRVMVAPGERTMRGAPLVQLYDDSQLEVRAQVPSRYVATLRAALAEATPVVARLEENGVRLRLDRLSASIAQGQGGVDAFFRATQALPELGRTLTVQLELPPIAAAVLLNVDALYGSARVYVVEDAELRARSVQQLGLRQADGQTFMVVDGAAFQPGEQVLSSRLPQAVDGLKVEVAK